MDQFKRLVAYGCSLTAGTELGDHIAMDISIDECNELKRKVPLKQWRRFEKQYKLEQAGYYRSWAGHLSNHLALELDNRGVGSASIDQCLLRMKNSLHNSEDLVIVGLTYIQRALIFNHSTYSVIKHQDLETACWNYYRAIEQMIPYVHWFVQVADTKSSTAWKYCENKELKQYCRSVWEQIAPCYIPVTIPKNITVLGNGHPMESYHMHIARQMAERIKNEQTTT
jgi:hypothetical protein